MLLINTHFPHQDYSFFSLINCREKNPNNPVTAEMESIMIKQPVHTNLTTCFHITITACGNEPSVKNPKTWKEK